VDLEALFWGVLLAARLLPAILLVPAFGGQRVPIPAQIGLAGCLAACLFSHSAYAGICPSGLIYAGLLLKELALGLVLALAGVCIFEALRMAGQLIDGLRGASQARATMPQTGEQASPLGVMYMLLACVVFFELDGPVRFLNAVQASLKTLPIDRFPGEELLGRAGELVLALTSTAIETGIRIAWPVAVSLLFVDVLLGFINRTAPAIQVFFLGMPLKAALGLLLVALTLDLAVAEFAAMLPGV
jgi:flagellar biosynthetic protein FliR